MRDIGQESRRRIRKGAVLLAATGALALSACGDSGDDPTLIFDDLGGGSPNVFVYPGVGATTEDKEPVDTYQDGDQVRAFCRATGRVVMSDPGVGEEARTSDEWVRISELAAKPVFATSVYAENPGDLLSGLPECD